MTVIDRPETVSDRLTDKSLFRSESFIGGGTLLVQHRMEMRATARPAMIRALGVWRRRTILVRIAH